MIVSPYQDPQHLLSSLPLPDLVLLRQHFARPRLQHIAEVIHHELTRDESLTNRMAGARIAIAVGSRGIAEITSIVRSVVATLRHCGAQPFVFPAMGSHGGATPEGQKAVLADLGISEETIGAPIISSMDVDFLGSLPSGPNVYIDRVAHAADGIVVINRVKPHTDFEAPIESGLSKMIAIGMGKQRGAQEIHSWGIEGLAHYLPEIARFVVDRAPFLFGLAIVENAYDEIAEIALLSPEEIGRQPEQQLLARAKALMPYLPWERLDVLIVDEIGKNISGAGMDPNIIGRIRSGKQKPMATDICNVVALGVTPASHGNAIGLGLADFTTIHLLEQADFQSIYTNGLTAGVIAMNEMKIPMVLRTDREAVAAAICTCGCPHHSQVRLARIKNTLSLEYILASPACLECLRSGSNVEVIRDAQPWKIAGDGTLLSFG